MVASRSLPGIFLSALIAVRLYETAFTFAYVANALFKVKQKLYTCDSAPNLDPVMIDRLIGVTTPIGVDTPPPIDGLTGRFGQDLRYSRPVWHLAHSPPEGASA